MAKRKLMVLAGVLVVAAIATILGLLLADKRDRAREHRAFRAEITSFCRDVHQGLWLETQGLKLEVRTVEHLNVAREWILLSASYCVAPDAVRERAVREALLRLDTLGEEQVPEAIEVIEQALGGLAEWGPRLLESSEGGRSER